MISELYEHEDISVLVGLPVEAYSDPQCGHLMGCTALEPAFEN
jgi:hypothetical protein